MSTLTLHGQENLAAKPAFYMPNRLTPESLCALHEMLGGKVCFLSDTGCPPAAELRQALDQLGAALLPFNFRHTTPLAVRSQVCEQFDAGRSVIYLPGEVAKIRGSVADVPAPYLMSLGSLHISTIPVYLGQFGDTIETFVDDAAKGGRQTLTILPKLSPGPQAGARLLAAWLECRAEQMAQQPLMSQSLTTLLVHAMRSHPRQEVVDGLTGGAANNTKLLGVAMALAKRLKKLGDARIGVVLPPGPGAVIVTMACLLSGTTAAMLNYAAPRESIESATRQAGLRHFLTARKFKEKLPAFAWPSEDKLLFMEDELGAIGKASLLAHILMARTMPAGLICRLYNTDARRDGAEAAMLFTSGSSGEPKGVALTHRMLIADLAQSTCRISFNNDRFLGSLPVFHSFGLITTMLLPLITGQMFCTYPNPKDTHRLNELVKKHKLTLLCTTPTFVRSMMRRAQDDTYASVRYLIVGAEKLPKSLADEFQARFGIPLLEGYGLTEAAPVCSTNLPDAPLLPTTACYVPGYVPETVGAPLPGIAIRITDVDDDSRELPLTEQGMLWFKGPNFFTGYVGREDLNPEIFSDGWFKSGDIGRVDLNGFITLGGRLSRFSKLGGEMVPHEGVEQAVISALGLDVIAKLGLEGDSGTPQVAITSIPDEQKGEALVLLSAIPAHGREEGRRLALNTIRTAFAARDIPNLWVPRNLLPVEQIPILPTGKLDLRRCKLLAAESLLPQKGL